MKWIYYSIPLPSFNCTLIMCDIEDENGAFVETFVAEKITCKP